MAHAAAGGGAGRRRGSRQRRRRLRPGMCVLGPHASTLLPRHLLNAVQYYKQAVAFKTSPVASMCQQQ